LIFLGNQLGLNRTGRTNQCHLEPEIVDYLFFRLCQLPRRFIFDGNDVPTRSFRHTALGRVAESGMRMLARVLTPFIGPPDFVMAIQGFVTTPQSGHDLD
jgi:hypothetical protein